MNPRLSVLIVDDSAFMRLALRRIIEAEGDLFVVGEASDGAAALELVLRLAPDVVAMDIEMPGMDGLECTRRLMAQAAPPAIIMVSHHTTQGSPMALAAMQAGAADWISKDTGLGGLDLGHLDRELRARMRHWGQAHRACHPLGLPIAGDTRLNARGAAAGVEVVVVGASTGGPNALGTLLAATGRLTVPMVLAQHMPEGMAADFARALARQTGLAVRVAEQGAPLLAGQVVLIPGGQDGALLRLARGEGRGETREEASEVAREEARGIKPGGLWGAGESGGLALRLSPRASAAHPSVDVLFTSAAMAAHGALGVVLTGMGQDGAAGAAALARRGCPILAQSAESCVVAGMPNAARALVPGAGSGTPAELGARIKALASPPLRPA